MKRFLMVSCLLGLTIGCGDTPVAPLPTTQSDRTNTPRPADPSKTGVLPYDVEPLDQTPDGDMSSDAEDDAEVDTPPDVPADPCDVPERCTTPNADACLGTQIRRCERNDQGCFVWGEARDCPASTLCMEDVCTLVDECLDADQDGYGAGCPLGPDCDDSDREINPGRPEICDGVDNNCDNRVDDLPGVGDACEAGLGICAASGQRVCNASGQVMCSAQPGQPDLMETCGDNLDNDCDGVVDQGCPPPPTPACGDDPYEPNNTLATAHVVTVNQGAFGFICMGDSDYFELPTSAGVTYRLNLAFPNSNADLDLVLYEDNGVSRTSISVTDHEQIEFTAQANKTYHAEIRNIANGSNFYKLALTDTWDCSQEDALEPNDQLSYVNLLPSGWRTDAFICPNNRDFYYMGTVDSGETITIGAYFTTSFFLGEGDLDLYLYGDDDGDGTFNQIATAETSGDDEFLTHVATFTGRYAFIVRGYASDDNDYEILWVKTP